MPDTMAFAQDVQHARPRNRKDPWQTLTPTVTHVVYTNQITFLETAERKYLI